MSKSPQPRFVTITTFLAVISVFLFIANFVIYEAVAEIFSITFLWQLTFLGSMLGILSGSFIVATVLGMYFYNVWTRIYYLIACVWIGFFFYLFLVSFLYGVLIMILGSAVYVNSIGAVLVAVAFLTSIYGVVHARDIHVVEKNVVLPNLPSAWQGRRALWISDVHLGQLHGSSFAEKIVGRVNTLRHDIVFIGGDLYDGTGAPDIHELTAPFKKLDPSLGTYFITGNHEEFGNNTAFISAVKAVGMHTLIDEMVEIDGLQIIGVDYRAASKKENFKNILDRINISPAKPSILLKHEPKDVDVAFSAGISFQVSGHTHKAQVWPLNYIADSVYKGFGYGLKKYKDMQVYTSSGVGTWGPPLRVGSNSEIVIFTFTS
jgi:predicted MPP superfamily phosphohydrolase